MHSVINHVYVHNMDNVCLLKALVNFSRTDQFKNVLMIVDQEHKFDVKCVNMDNVCAIPGIRFDCYTHEYYYVQIQLLIFTAQCEYVFMIYGTHTQWLHPQARKR